MGVDEREKGVGREEQGAVREGLGGSRVRVVVAILEQRHLRERLAGTDDVEHQHPALRTQPVHMDAALYEKIEAPIRLLLLKQNRATCRRAGPAKLDELLTLLRRNASEEGMGAHCVGDVGG